MKIFKKTLLAASVFAIAGVANAMPITGSIGFTGAYTTDTGLLGTATTINITDAAVNGTVSGSFAAAGITSASAVSYSNFTFDPTTVPVSNLWKVGGFSFGLTQMNVDYHSSTALVLSGTGMISSVDVDTFDPTPGAWTFTTNTAGGDNFTWSSSSSATKSVPEPAVALLLGTGLVGFGVARKARKARKAA